jgi:hypothetical protein
MTLLLPFPPPLPQNLLLWISRYHGVHCSQASVCECCIIITFKFNNLIPLAPPFCLLPFSIFFSNDNLLGIILIWFTLNSNIFRSHDNDIRISLCDTAYANVRLVSFTNFAVINSKTTLILNVRLVNSYFWVSSSFVKLSIVDNIHVILNTEFKLENSTRVLHLTFLHA